MKHQFKYVHDFEIKWDGRRKNPDFQVFVKSARGFDYRPYSSYNTGRPLEAVLADLRYAAKEELVGRNHDAQRGNVMYRIEHHNLKKIFASPPQGQNVMGAITAMFHVRVGQFSPRKGIRKRMIEAEARCLNRDGWCVKSEKPRQRIVYPAMYSNALTGPFEDPGMRTLFMNMTKAKPTKDSPYWPDLSGDHIIFGCRNLSTLGEYFWNDREMFESMTKLGFKVAKYRARTVYHGLRQSICFKEADQMKLEKVYDEPIEKLLLGT